MNNLSIFKAKASDKRNGFAFEGFKHNNDRTEMSERLMFRDKADARTYCKLYALKAWNF